MLKALAEAWGGEVKMRYAEMIEQEPEEDYEEVTGDEIALEIIKRAGLKGKHDGLNEPSSENIA